MGLGINASREIEFGSKRGGLTRVSLRVRMSARKSRTTRLSGFRVCGLMRIVRMRRAIVRGHDHRHIAVKRTLRNVRRVRRGRGRHPVRRARGWGVAWWRVPACHGATLKASARRSREHDDSNALQRMSFVQWSIRVEGSFDRFHTVRRLSERDLAARLLAATLLVPPRFPCPPGPSSPSRL